MYLFIIICLFIHYLFINIIYLLYYYYLFIYLFIIYLFICYSISLTTARQKLSTMEINVVCWRIFIVEHLWKRPHDGINGRTSKWRVSCLHVHSVVSFVFLQFHVCFHERLRMILAKDSRMDVDCLPSF